MLKRWAIVGAMVTALMPAARAEGASILTLNTGASVIIVPSAGGPIGVVGGIGLWSDLNLTALAGTNPLMDLNLTSFSSSAGALPLTIQFSSNNFGGPFSSLFTTINGTLGAGHTLMYQVWANTNNTLDATQCLVSSQVFGPGGAISGSAQGNCAVGALYSLTQRVVITSSQVGSGSFDARVTTTPVPEPGSVALLVTGLIGVAMASRRRVRTRANR